jgi:putative tryptophan/tyrosine transport system substrate-binding protein
MRRREFIAGLAGAATWPLAAGAQQPSMPVVGWLQSTSRGANQQFLALFRKGLSEMGYVEGRNIAMEMRYAGNELQRLPELAADLVRRRVAIIAALGGTGQVSAAMSATTTIPIVFEVGVDPVQVGLVASLSRPGGNATGVSSMNNPLVAVETGDNLTQEFESLASKIGRLLRQSSDVATWSRQTYDEAVAEWVCRHRKDDGDDRCRLL